MPSRSNDYFNLLQQVGFYVPRASASLPQTATNTIFTVTGPVLLTGLMLEISTAVQAQANAIKFRHTPTGGTVADISGTLDINGYAVGDFVLLQGPTTAGALSQSPTGMRLSTGGAGGFTSFRGTGGIILLSGSLGLNTAASSTGAFKAHCFWAPLPGFGGGKIIAA